MTAEPMPQVTVLVAWQHGPLTDPNLIDGYLGPDNVAANKWTIMSRSGAGPGLVTELPAGGRGRQHELAVFEAAARRMRLDNSDGRFNPWNTLSPYAGWLKPGRLMRVLAQWNLLSQQFPGLTNYPRSTSTSFVTTVGLPTGGNVHRYFAVEPSRRYSARVAAVDTLAGNTIRIVFRWYNATGAHFATSTSPATAIPTGAPVIVEYSDVTPPAAAHSAQVLLEHQTGLGSTSGTATFTDAGAWPTGAPPTYVAAVGSPVRFTGHLHAFDPEWPDRRSFYVDAEASDLLRNLNTLDLPPTAYDLELAADDPTHLWRLSEGPGAEVANDEGSSPLPGVYDPAARLGGEALAAGSNATSMGIPSAAGPYGMTVDGPVVPATGPFTVQFDYQAGANAEAIHIFGGHTGQATFRFQSGLFGITELYVTNDAGTTFTRSVASLNDGEPHHVVISRSGTTWQLTIDGVAAAALTVTDPTTISTKLFVGRSQNGGVDAGTIANVAVFNTALSSARRTAQHAAFAGTAWSGDTASTRAGRILDHLGLPTALRSLDATCVSPLAAVSKLGGTALAYLQQLERAEAGALYVDRTGKLTLLSRQTILDRAYDPPAVTFGDLPGHVPFQPGPSMTFNDSEIVNEVTAGREGGLTVTVVDAASREDNGPRSRDLTGLLVSRDTEVVDRAHFELATYGEARFVLRNLDIWPLEAVGLIEHLLGLDLLQLVDVVRSDIAGDALDQPSLLERIDETFTPTDWRIGVAVSPHQAEQFWILGVSQLGVNTRLGF